MAEDEIFAWHHQLSRREFEPILGDSGRQRSVVCCSPWVAESRLSNSGDSSLWVRLRGFIP